MYWKLFWEEWSSDRSQIHLIIEFIAQVCCYAYILQPYHIPLSRISGFNHGFNHDRVRSSSSVVFGCIIRPRGRSYKQRAAKTARFPKVQPFRLQPWNCAAQTATRRRLHSGNLQSPTWKSLYCGKLSIFQDHLPDKYRCANRHLFASWKIFHFSRKTYERHGFVQNIYIFLLSA